MAIDTRKLKTGIFITLMSFWLAAACLAAPPAADSDAAQSEYQAWVDRHEKKEFTGRTMQGEPAPLKLLIAAVEGDDLPQNPRFSTEVEHSTEIAMDGHVWGFHSSSWGRGGGGGGTVLPAATLARIDELVTGLPDEAPRLPPPGRRLLLQAAVGNKIVAHVIDRGNAPDGFWEILHLCGVASIGSLVPEFKPRSEIKARGFKHDGFLCLSPDGRQILFSGEGETLQFWAPTTHELLAEKLDLGNRNIGFSPDGAQAVIGDVRGCAFVDTATWKLRMQIRPTSNSLQFTPDGRSVMMQTRRRPMEVYDAGTGQRIDRLPEAPDDVVKYVPARKSKRAVVQSGTEIVSLWDTAQHREIAKLRENAELYEAAFSPDESLVVVATQSTVRGESWTGASIDIWRADTGAKMHELRPFEVGADSNQGIRHLLWSPDGQYVLTGTEPRNPSPRGVGVNVFSVRSGRHRGQFICPMINGMALLPDASEFITGTQNGSICFWDFQDAMKEIRAFEKSLEPVPAP